jgi:hypothetical protein
LIFWQTQQVNEQDKCQRFFQRRGNFWKSQNFGAKQEELRAMPFMFLMEGFQISHDGFGIRAIQTELGIGWSGLIGESEPETSP